MRAEGARERGAVLRAYEPFSAAGRRTLAESWGEKAGNSAGVGPRGGRARVGAFVRGFKPSAGRLEPSTKTPHLSHTSQHDLVFPRFPPATAAPGRLRPRSRAH